MEVDIDVNKCGDVMQNTGFMIFQNLEDQVLEDFRFLRKLKIAKGVVGRERIRRSCRLEGHSTSLPPETWLTVCRAYAIIRTQ